MTESNPDPVYLLRDFNLHRVNAELLDESGSLVSTLNEAKYIQLGSNKFDKSTTTTFQSKINNENYYSLDALYHATITRKLHHTEYSQDATRQQIPTRLAYMDRKDWLLFINGFALLPDENNRQNKEAVASTLSSHSSSRHHSEKRRQPPPTEETEEDIKKKRVKREEYRKNYESLLKAIAPTEIVIFEDDIMFEGLGDYASWIKSADDYFLKRSHNSLGQERNSEASRSSRSHHKKSKGPKVPLILVPPSFNAFISMYNVKQLLGDQRFEPGSSVRISGGKIEHNVSITHNGIQYEITDNVKSLRDSDWDRVVCVITDGNEWVFKTYKWRTPEDTFNNVVGVYFKYNNEITHPKVQKWKVNIIEIHPEMRHKDAEAYLDFWNAVLKKSNV
ncbi:RNA pol II accessory factor, Cdc73 family-domain-containing protein [Glomus cerebriforme]|uniref:RNA pol II accessory factor, Cdc73 family-domain-containing protein n=1 Tax=Glomus cerebriforme TaxID=658196 RepID=A0A397T7K5_9GLOM|nr:RNA pol II accessory factor, Cdc73 family-domain-containing protein [Glomus cerebriforme]